MTPDNWLEYEQEKWRLMDEEQKPDTPHPDGWYEQQLIHMIERLGL